MSIKVLSGKETVMDVVNVSQLKESLSEYLNRAAYGQERIIIASRGKPKVAMISIRDLERLEELEDALAAREALAEHERGETISLERLMAELEEAGRGLSA
jgi:prevent-host-death family protein